MKHRARRVLYALLILCGALSRPAAAQLCPDTDSCLKLIEAKQADTRTLAARFTQTKHLSLMNEPLVSRGRFAFRKPNGVLWEVEDPPLLIRIDGERVSLPNRPELESEARAMAPLTTMLRELSGVFTGATTNLRKRFNVAADASESEINVHLEPKSAEWQRLFSSIDLTFAAPDLVVRRMQLQERIGDKLEVEFSELHRNDATADAWIAIPTP